jgi:hypothetical protein
MTVIIQGIQSAGHQPREAQDEAEKWYYVSLVILFDDPILTYEILLNITIRPTNI